MAIVDVFIFILAVFVSFYLPGSLTLRLLSLKLSKSENFILSWLVGIVFFYLVIYFSALINLDKLPLYIVIVLVLVSFVYTIKKRAGKIRFVKPDFDIPVISFIILGALAFSYIMYFSGYIVGDGLQFMHVNAIDGIRHISYIKNMVFNFPPEHPGLAGIEIIGFHYAYDFILSRFILYYGLQANDLYFRFFPFFISLLYGASFYMAARVFKAGTIKILWILFFAFFSQSFSFLLLAISENVDLVRHAIVQPIGLIVNPFTVLSIAFLVAGVSLFTKIKDSWKYAVLVGLLLGIISQMKVYAGLIAIGSIVIYSAYTLFYKRQNIKNFLIANATTAIITAITYLPNNMGAGGLVWAPFLFFRHHMQQTFYDAIFQWELKRLVFAENNNYIRVILLYLQAITIFVVVNFGLRLIVILRIKQIFTKKFWKDELSFIWLSIFLTPFIIATFFIQGGATAFNTVQFFWIPLALLSIPSGLAMGDLFIKSKKILKLAILLFVLVITVPSIIRFLADYWVGAKVYMVDKEDVDLFEKVRMEVSEKEFIIYIPEKPIPHEGGNLLLSSMIGRSVYIEPGNIPNKRNEYIHNTRNKRVMDLNLALEKCDKNTIISIISEINSKYILTKSPILCLPDEFDLEKSFSSQNYHFYHLGLF